MEKSIGDPSLMTENLLWGQYSLFIRSSETSPEGLPFVLVAVLLAPLHSRVGRHGIRREGMLWVRKDEALGRQQVELRP